MTLKKRTDDVAFVAEYDDGSEDRFSVDSFTLRGSDAIAKIIAGQWQAGGRLKPGKIVRVRRVVGLDAPPRR